MGKLLNTGLAVGGTALALGALRRSLNPSPRYAPWEKPRYDEFEKKVLVVGGGFGGYSAATKLMEKLKGRDDVGVLVLARDNFFTFWPMVPGIVSSDIDSRNVAQPLRRALVFAGASFRRAELQSVDTENKTVMAGGKEFPYDHLVLSLGGQPNFFGIPGVEENSMKMKGVQDAERIRNRVIERFEEVSMMRGEVPDSKLTFVVIGAGATGVETASEIHSLVHEALAPDYPNVDAHRVRIILLEGLPNILPEIDPGLQNAARAQLVSKRIEVRTGTLAREITEDRVKLNDDTEINTENVVWTAGNRPNSLIPELGLPYDDRNGIETDEYMRVKDSPGVWSIGDCAAVPDGHGNFSPPTAQAANQQGYAVAGNIVASIDGQEDEMESFEYRPIGQLVEIGGDFAVNEVMGVRFSGLIAALFWRAAYLFRLQSPQSKARIAADWILGLFLRPAVTQLRGSDE
jgi:NADH dehydrogenase